MKESPLVDTECPRFKNGCKIGCNYRFIVLFVVWEVMGSVVWLGVCVILGAMVLSSQYFTGEYWLYQYIHSF